MSSTPVPAPRVDRKTVAQVLEQIAAFLELKGENPFRIRAFHTAARAIGGLTVELGQALEDGTLAATKGVGPATLQTLHALEMDMFFTVAVGTAAFLLGSGVGALKSGVLPSWLAWAAIVIGVIAITPLGFFGFLALGIWTLIVSVMLAMRARVAPAPGVA